MKISTRSQPWLFAALGLALLFTSPASAGLGRSADSSAPRREPTRVETADRFDWTDAAVGAGVATGLLVAGSAARGSKHWFERGDRKEHT